MKTKFVETKGYGAFDLYYTSCMAPVGVNKDGILEIAYRIQGCRGYFGDNTFYLKNKKHNNSNYPVASFYSVDKGDTMVAVIGTEATINENLATLHAKEKKAGVKLSEVFKTQHTNLFLVVGSSYWKKKCWSIMLYTYYVKCLVNDDTPNQSYMNKLQEKNDDRNTKEEVFLSKVKTKKEIFSTEVYGKTLSSNVHCCEGFYEICYGNNPPMAKFLGINTGRPDNWFKTVGQGRWL